MAKTIRESNLRSMLDLIFNEDWNSLDEFDEKLDLLAEYQSDVQTGVACYYENI